MRKISTDLWVRVGWCSQFIPGNMQVTRAGYVLCSARSADVSHRMCLIFLKAAGGSLNPLLVLREFEALQSFIWCLFSL